MSFVTVGFGPHTGHSGLLRSFSSRNFSPSASKSRSLPIKLSPLPRMSLMASSGSKLGASHILGAMNHLALEIREVHNVKIYNAQPADSRRGEIKREGRAKSAGPDTEYFGSLQLELTLHADLRHDQVPAITQ